MIKRYIITGAPGTGKSSIIEHLKAKGYHCFDEVSRIIISEQQIINGDLLPWKNLLGFADECYMRMQSQLNHAMRGINIYDRGIPDIIAYLKNGNIHNTKSYLSEINQYKQHVFYCPIWDDIYINDPQRPESLDYAKKIDFHLRNTYKNLGFNLLELPKEPIDLRVGFIEQKILSFYSHD